MRLTRDPSLPLVQFYSDEKTKKTIRADLQAAGSYAIGVGPSMDDVDHDLVESAHARCLAVHPYTLAEKPDMRDLVGLGVDGMFTDFANRLEAVLGEESVDGNLAAGKAADASWRGLAEPGLERRCRTPAGSLLLPTSSGALLLSLGLPAAVLRRV